MTCTNPECSRKRFSGSEEMSQRNILRKSLSGSQQTICIVSAPGSPERERDKCPLLLLTLNPDSLPVIFPGTDRPECQAWVRLNSSEDMGQTDIDGDLKPVPLTFKIASQSSGLSGVVVIIHQHTTFGSKRIQRVQKTLDG